MKGGKVYGKVVDIFLLKKDVCQTVLEDKNKSNLGLVLIKGLSKDGQEYNGGKITDPSLVKCISVLLL
jgi:uncharacterized protein (DUF2147 family)